MHPNTEVQGVGIHRRSVIIWVIGNLFSQGRIYVDVKGNGNFILDSE